MCSKSGTPEVAPPQLHGTQGHHADKSPDARMNGAARGRLEEPYIGLGERGGGRCGWQATLELGHDCLGHGAFPEAVQAECVRPMFAVVHTRRVARWGSPAALAGTRVGDVMAAGAADAVDKEPPQGLLVLVVPADAPEAGQAGLQGCGGGCDRCWERGHGVCAGCQGCRGELEAAEALVPEIASQLDGGG